MDWFSSSDFATLQAVIPEPMMAISVVSGRTADCTADTVGCGGSCQKATVGFGRGSWGSLVSRDETSRESSASPLVDLLSLCIEKANQDRA